MKKNLIASLALASALSACSSIPQDAFFNRGTPESLLDTSSEVVNVPLDDAAASEQLTSWINQEQPSRADLVCSEGEPACDKAKHVLEQFNVSYDQKDSGTGTPKVALYYERVVARDCENRYIDNSINPYNLNYPTFGCSVAANIVQHVTDKRQFVNPNLLDYPDAEKSAQVYRDDYINTAAPAKQDGYPTATPSMLGGTGSAPGSGQ